MRATIVPPGLLFATFLLAGLPNPTQAGSNRYVEDFTTTQYQDTLNTTAWWDTVSGALKLFPFAPKLTGTYDTPGTALGVDVSGDHAFVADGASGLQVIDISDPAAPVVAGTVGTPGAAYDIHVAGDWAYVADDGSGLQVIDITDLSAPVLAGAYDTPGRARGVDVSGDYVFVADWASGLQVIDITNPTVPTLAGNCATASRAHDVYVSGNYAFVADGTTGLQVVDITNPAAPSLAGSYDTPGTATGVEVSGDYAYVADDGSGLLVIDISNPTTPTLAGTYDTPGRAYGIYVSGDWAYVADDGSGLHVINISDPAAPTLAGTVDTAGSSYDVCVWGEHAFVADETAGLQVVDITSPTTLMTAGAYDTPGTARGVYISGDHAFVADDSLGLHVIDITNPAAPVPAGTYDTPGTARGVYISGDHAFVADATGGLVVVNISNPAAPALAGTWSTASQCRSVCVLGDHAFVADYVWGGLQVIDITNPAAPVLAGTYDTPGSAWGLDVSGDHAFVADGLSVGLTVVDISNPAAPTPVGSCLTPGGFEAVDVLGNFAFVADGSYGFHAMDVSDPTAPTIIETYGSWTWPGHAYDVQVSGDHAFLADEAVGLHVIQVFQAEFDADNNVARSLALDAANDTIIRTRVMTTQTDSVAWELSTDGGVNWQGVDPDGSWNLPTVPGTDLVWRSTHAWAAVGANPSVTQLEIDWLVQAAAIETIADVPDDQGGWVRAHFTRSGYDFPDEPSLPIFEYGIWQRVDNPALLVALNASSSTADGRATGDSSVFTHRGRTYVRSRAGLAASSFPPGTWELVMSVPALQQDTYVARVPTVADSSGTGPHYSVFVVSAHTTTPAIWYVSHPDSGYSVDNIAPAVPTSFAVAYNTGSGNQLSWDPSPDEDFQYFRVYRSSDPEFVPSPAELVHSTIATGWTDPEYDGWNIYYKITALDYVGNESDPASAGTATGITGRVIPGQFALYQNVPNPFNPVTVIRYDVPDGGGKMTLRIYDVSGRLVRTLVDGTESPGEKAATWDGRDERGHMAASGVYFYRMATTRYTTTRKLVLMK